MRRQTTNGHLLFAIGPCNPLTCSCRVGMLDWICRRPVLRYDPGSSSQPLPQDQLTASSATQGAGKKGHLMSDIEEPGGLYPLAWDFNHHAAFGSL